MERALDPELLGLALGQHENLPSPQELSQLLAEAELALLLRAPHISEQLVAIGWYLHAIASSKYALQAYGVARQRAAFQVVGHIFDLLLQAPEVTRIARLKYCFAAQIAYIRSTLDPNAIAIYKRELAGTLKNLGLLSDFNEVALSCGTAFLGFDVDYVYKVTRNLRDESDNLVTAWEVDNILSTPFGSAAYVALGARHLMSFLIYGRLDLLELARERLGAAVFAEASDGDSISRWVAAHLLNLSDGLEHSSVWTVLPPNVPAHVRRAFTTGAPRILTLWPPQLDLLTAEDTVNPLSSEVKRLFLSTPTSGGKTLMAQLLVASHLATEPTSVCYVAPTRSLCREIRESLGARLRFLERQIVDGLPEGDWLDALLATLEPKVEIMTPERLSYLIRTNSERLLENFGMFIFDEVHLVGEAGRGWTLEEDLTYLHYATQNRKHRIILISAAIGNRNHFVQWMSENGNEPFHIHSEWRGPRRLYAIWTTVADWGNSTQRISERAKKYPYVQECPLYGKLTVRISHSGKIHSLPTDEPIGTLVRKGNTETNLVKDSAKSTPFYKMLIPLIQYLAQFGAVLIVESTKPGTIRMAKALAEEQQVVKLPQVRTVVDLVTVRLGSNHPLKSVLEKGVAYHHGSLPGEIRTAIEEIVSQGFIKFLVATTTMTEGVNIPVTSVVIASQGSHGREGYTEYITGPKLINAIGRAGRATKETEGVVVLARNAPSSDDDFKRLNPDERDIHTTSMLATEDALNALAEFEDFCRTAEDAVFQMATGSVAGFLRFVWFVTAKLEELGELPILKHLDEVLGHTLGWLQLEPTDRARWLNIASLMLDRYQVTEPTARRRWAASGTSISSASELEQIARELSAVVENLEVTLETLEAVDFIIDGGRLLRILELPEAPKQSIYTHRGGARREEIEIPVGLVLRQWLEGVPLVTLVDSYLSSVPDVDFRFEQLGDFINKYFEVYLPWAVGTIVSWTNDILQESGKKPILPTLLSASIRYGVSDPIAIELMVGGVQSRNLALKVAKAWAQEKRETSVRAWIRSLSLVQWQEIFDASTVDLRNLLEFSRARRGGIAVNLINREFAETEVESEVVDFPETEVLLSPIGESEFSPIGIWVGDNLVGCIHARDQADIQSLLDASLIFLAKFSSVSGKGALELTLLDPE